MVERELGAPALVVHGLQLRTLESVFLAQLLEQGRADPVHPAGAEFFELARKRKRIERARPAHDHEHDVTGTDAVVFVVDDDGFAFRLARLLLGGKRHLLRVEEAQLVVLVVQPDLSRLAVADEKRHGGPLFDDDAVAEDFLVAIRNRNRASAFGGDHRIGSFHFSFLFQVASLRTM